MGFNNHARYWWNLCSYCIRACLLAFVFLTSQNAMANCYGSSGEYWSNDGYCNGWSILKLVNVAPVTTSGSLHYKYCSPTFSRYPKSDGLTCGTLAQATASCASGSTYNSATGLCELPHSCPSNSTWDSVGQTCRCDTGYMLFQNACRVNNCPATGEKNDLFGDVATTTAKTVNPPQNICIDGCCYKVKDTCMGAGKIGESRTWSCNVGVGNGQFSDGTSTAGMPDSTQEQTSNNPNEPKTPYDCYTSGKVYGEVNGMGTCVTPAGDTNVVQSSNKTQTTTTANGDGTSTSTSTTTNETKSTDGSGNITTLSSTSESKTTTNASGVSSTTTASSVASKSETKESYCKENPNDSVCKNSAFSGSCSGAFKCEGDAIQCAVAKEQHEKNCALFDDVTPLSQLGNSLANGDDLLGSNNPFNESNKLKIDFSGSDGQLDKSRLWGGQCISDQTFTVYGQSITLDTSKLCDVIGLFGNLLVAISMISGMMIIGKGA